jgi:4-hydroxyphenylpyruvate dioxygenase
MPLAKSIATVSLSGTLIEKLEAAAAIGFDGVEIFENDLLAFDGTPAEIRTVADSLGLAITIFQPFRDFEGMAEPQRSRNLDRAERKFDVMEALGTDLLLVCSNVQPQALDDPARIAADLAELAERAGRRGLRIGFEALSWGTHIRRWRDAWHFVQQIDHPSLGLVIDSFHTLALGDHFAGLAELPAEKLFFVQLADAPKLNMDVLSWSRHFRNFPGQGGLDVTGFLRAALATGYRGPLSLEVFNDEFRTAPARLIARDGLRSLILAEAQAGGPALPPPPRFDGVEFLEFAVDAATGPELAGFLETMGFQLAATHRSKSVQLYRNGQINLVLNAEQDSAAESHFHLHGPSVCAMAMRVDDAAAALARARALLCPAWQEKTGAGERQIPALRAPDGTLIYLVQPDPTGRSIWEDDFNILPIAVPDPTGPNVVDHIAQALQSGRLDTFVLFYRAVFGMVPEALHELPDPYGLIRSRAVSSTDGSIRLPLNISDSRETATGRFVSQFFGAGVHHVAFATPDIAETVRAWTAKGARMLAIPANYYDDLGAKFGLDDETLEMLKALNLLYDRDETGTFLQAYTEQFQDRFFFEIVQRTGYLGFGAANAAIRMAAQAQSRG